mgnify:CR=1 FL=1
MRTLGLDLGSKTLGVSVSDALGMIARPVETLRFESDDYDSAFEQVKKYIKEFQITTAVLGLPKHMNGDVGIRGEISYAFKEKLEIVRNIIRESLSGNAAFALLVYSLLHSLPIKTFADLFVTILLFIAIIAVVIWLFLIIYVYFCELFRSHWIAVWFILWSVVINLTIGFGIYDKLAPVISLMK